MLDMIECIWNKRIKVTLNFEFNGGNIMIYCIVMGICAMFMFGIGLVQIKSQKPVAFYSGEKPPMGVPYHQSCRWCPLSQGGQSYLT